MEISNIDWEWQSQAAKIRLSEIDGDTFEHEVQSILKNLWRDDFSSTIPMGSRGDLKCDGYRHSTATVYQCYGPRYGQVNVHEAVKKINDDFRSAKSHWGVNLKEWKFVVNVYKDKLPSEVVREIASLSNELGVAAGPIDRSDLLELIRVLPNNERVRLYGRSPISAAVQHKAHDVQLYRKMKALLGGSGLIKFLDEQDMGFGHEIGRISNLWRFAEEWKNPELKFIDNTMDNFRLAMIEKAIEYRNAHCEYMSESGNRYVMNVSPGVMPELDPLEFGRLKKMKSHIHGLANEFVILYEQFVHMGKLRLPLKQ